MKSALRALGQIALVVVIGLVLTALLPHEAHGVTLALVTTTVLDPLMKVIANEPLVNTALAENQLSDIIDVDMNIEQDQTTQGRYKELALILGLPGAVGARAEDEVLPTAVNPLSANIRVYLRSLYGTLDMTGLVMRRVKNDEGAFLNWAEEQFPLFGKRLGHHMDRVDIGYGYGIIGRTTETFQGGGPYTVKLNRPLGVTGWTGVVRQLQEGDSLVFSSGATGVALRNPGSTQAAQVTDISTSLEQITITANAALAAAVLANDYVFPGDGAGFSGQKAGVNREPQGLVAAVDDGSILSTYLNQPRSLNRQWAGLVFDASVPEFGGNISEEFLVFCDDETTQETGEKLTHILLSYKLGRAYWKSLKTDRSFVNPRGQYTGGMGPGPQMVQLTDREIPLRVVRKFPDQLLMGLNKAYWRRYMLGQYEWDDTAGSIWNRSISSDGPLDKFYAVGFTDYELACRWPRTNFRATGLVV